MATRNKLCRKKVGNLWFKMSEGRGLGQENEPITRQRNKYFKMLCGCVYGNPC